MSEPRLYGLLAEFDSASRLVAAVIEVRRRGRYEAEAYSPFPVEGLCEVLGAKRDRISLAMLLGAAAGGIGTFALEWYAAVVNYPLNIGGRPAFSWPAFVPPAIEMTILGAALFGVLALLIGSALPQVHHPLFAIDAFERASSDRFFLLLRASDSTFEPDAARALLQSLEPLTINEVAA